MLYDAGATSKWTERLRNAGLDAAALAKTGLVIYILQDPGQPVILIACERSGECCMHKPDDGHDMTLDHTQLAALRESTAMVRSRLAATPKTAVILGSGLAEIADQIQAPVVFDYCELPGFVKSTASGHRGQLICGHWEGVNLVAMAGRFHRYEGYSDFEITLPVRLFAALGVNRLVLSNAAGGLCPMLKVGDVVVLSDHIDLARRSSLEAGEGDDLIASARDLYDPELMEAALQAARQADFLARTGVYLAASGPAYETRAEYRMMRMLGADVVGMSTAPEAALAGQLGMRVLGLSIVTNVARPDHPQPADHDQVLAVGRATASKLRAILAAVVGPAQSPAGNHSRQTVQ